MSKEPELPSPCPVCRKRHKTGSNPYKAHLRKYLDEIVPCPECKGREIAGDNEDFDITGCPMCMGKPLTRELHDWQQREAENYRPGDDVYPTSTEEFFARNPDKKLDTPSPNTPNPRAGVVKDETRQRSAEATRDGFDTQPGNMEPRKGKEASTGKITEVVTIAVPVEAVEHVKKGGTVSGELTRIEDGDKSRIPGNAEKCLYCKGTGKIINESALVYQDTFNCNMDKKCSYCAGKGYIETSPDHLTELCTICDHLIPFNTPEGVGYKCEQDTCDFVEIGRNKNFPDDIITTIVDDAIPGELIPAANAYIDLANEMDDTLPDIPRIPEGDWVTVGTYKDGETRELVTEEWAGAMIEFHAKVTAQEEVIDDIIKLYETIDPSLKGKIEHVEWNDSIKPVLRDKYTVQDSKGNDIGTWDGPGSHIKPPPDTVERLKRSKGLGVLPPSYDELKDALEKDTRGAEIVQGQVLDAAGIMPPSGAKHLTVSPGNDIKPKKKKWYQFWKRDKGE